MASPTFATYSASMSTSGSQSIDVSASGDGVAISADAVTVTTNCRAGYNLSVATSVNDNNLYYDGSVSNNANGTYFEPVDGINTLANNTNKWGYYYNSSSAVAPTKTNIFSAVPASSGTPAALVTPTASETDISDSFNVYFGVSINSNLKAGTYKMIQDANDNNGNGSITYYLTMATSCMPYTVVFNPTSTAGDSSVSGTGTMNSQTIPVGDATALNANTFTAPSGYEFDSWNTAQDGSGTTYADQASVTDLAAGGGEITLYAQWRVVVITCAANTICYDGNDATDGAMDDFEIPADYKKDLSSCNGGYDMEERICYTYDEDTGEFDEISFDNLPDNNYYTLDLLAPNYYKTGYGFAGWNTAPDGTGTNYGPNQTITTTNGETLYAKWVQSTGNMQSFSCSSLSSGAVTALTDARDNQTYAVAKLADGNCWMTENLRLNHNSTNPNWGNNNLSQGFGGAFVGLASKAGDAASSETANFSSSTTANSLYSTTNITGSNQGYRFPRYNNVNLGSTSMEVNSPDNNIYGYGNYYTWAAAIADTTNYTSQTDVTNTSICPAGWHLPTGTGTGGFGQLSNSLGGYNENDEAYDMYDSTEPTGMVMSATLRSYPNNFVYSGHYYYSNAYSRGNYGVYWSSTADNSNNAYDLNFGSDYVRPGTYSFNKYYGRPIRCVLGS